jgi:hypothetical protein
VSELWQGVLTCGPGHVPRVSMVPRARDPSPISLPRITLTNLPPPGKLLRSPYSKALPSPANCPCADHCHPCQALWNGHDTPIWALNASTRPSTTLIVTGSPLMVRPFSVTGSESSEPPPRLISRSAAQTATRP